MIVGLETAVGRASGIGIRPQFGRVALRQHVLAAAVVTFRRIAAVIGDERRILYAEVLRLVGVRESVAEIALDAVAIRDIGKC